MKNNYHKIMLDEISKNTNEIGLKLANKYEIKILKLIFKKNNGYRCSVDLSKQV